MNAFPLLLLGGAALLLTSKKKAASTASVCKKPASVPDAMNYRLAVIQDQSCATCSYGAARDTSLHCTYWKAAVSPRCVCDYYKGLA